MLEPDLEIFNNYPTHQIPNIQLFQTGLGKNEDLSVGMPDYVDDLSEDRKINTGYLSVLPARPMLLDKIL